MRVSFAGQYVSAVGKLQATLYLNGRLDLDVKVADFFELSTTKWEKNTSEEESWVETRHS